jgi:hypothetical protein
MTCPLTRTLKHRWAMLTRTTTCGGGGRRSNHRRGPRAQQGTALCTSSHPQPQVGTRCRCFRWIPAAGAISGGIQTSWDTLSVWLRPSAVMWVPHCTNSSYAAHPDPCRWPGRALSCPLLGIPTCCLCLTSFQALTSLARPPLRSSPSAWCSPGQGRTTTRAWQLTCRRVHASCWGRRPLTGAPGHHPPGRMRTPHQGMQVRGEEGRRDISDR